MSADLRAVVAPTQAQTVAEVAESYLLHLQARIAAGSYSLKAAANAERRLRDFLGHVGSLAIAQARQFHFTSWLTRKALRWGVRTRHDAQNIVLTCFRWAEDEELIDRSPFRKPRGMRYVHPDRPPAEEAHYVAVMRRCMGRRGSRALRRILYFLRATGCRQGEARNLRWEMIDWTQGLITLREHKTAHCTGRPRYVGLTPRLLRFLRALQRQSRSAYVFLDNRGKPFSGRTAADDERGKNKLCRLWKRWAKAAGVPDDVTLHAFRRAWTVRGIEAGIADRALADQAGWTTTRMVSHYGKGSRSRAAHLQQVAALVNQRRRLPPPRKDPPAPLFDGLD